MNSKFIEIINKYLQVDMGANTQNMSLKDLGLDSLASIDLLLELEDEFDVVFSDELLTEKTFENANTLWKIVHKLKESEVSI
ncbi:MULTISPECIES: phosphopantetheine-binding protein [Bacillus cereus group]|jgi:acyl carrier protein|uniref:phosphopantetheine-binding protein n=1 Tax=Bacillus cereus group TaxID=86661 RepID=UPI0037D2599C